MQGEAEIVEGAGADFLAEHFEVASGGVSGINHEVAVLFAHLRTTNPQDQQYIRKLMPEGEQDLADVLTTLRRGEALAVGEAIPLPTRFRLYPPDPAPDSSDAPVAESWRTGPDDLDVAGIVDRWWRQQR